jgi:histidinol dehydrogenase
MNVLPAQAAKVRRVAVTTPAAKDGSLSQAVLVALRTVASAGEVQAFKIGGAAAVAALALGTETVPRVDKVVGPGNRFVNEAKRQLWGAVGLDGYAGPSEVCILADETSNAKYAAADLLTQIEHAPDNCAFLVCSDEAKLNEILAEIDGQATGAPREETLRRALAGDSMAFLAKDRVQAIEIVNAVAPEHLGIITRDPESDMLQIRNAGCILLGEWSPESAGDFCAGPSHTLPTSGAARFGSPVNVLDFLKVQSVIRMTRDELRELTPIIETFGEMEGLPSHGRGATIRFE